MGASDLDDMVKFLRLVRQRMVQFFQPRQQHIACHHADGHMHGRRKRIIRRLAHVHMIIGVDRFFGAHYAAQHFDGAVADDLIRVHVGLGARPRLPDDQRKIVVKPPVDHLLRRSGDRLAQGFVDIALCDVDQGAGLLDHAKRADDGHGLTFPPDGEVDDRPLGLCAPVFVGRHVQCAKAIGFDAEFCHLRPRSGCGLL